MSEWQDISTAPKDGTKVLLYSKDDESEIIEVCYWIEEGIYDEPGWFCSDEEFCFVHPTHWMPIPDPPFTKKICHGAIWESIHNSDGIYAKCIGVEMGYRSVTFCPVCGESI